MFLLEVKRLIRSAPRSNSLNCTSCNSVLGGHPVLSGHLAISRGSPLNTGSTLHVVPGRIVSQSKLR